MFKCFPSRSMLRVTVLSYAVPLLCEIAAFSFTAATRLVNPVRALASLRPCVLASLRARGQAWQVEEPDADGLTMLGLVVRLQFNRQFVQRLEMVFSFNDVEALDSGLVFYVFYVAILGIWWDPLPPKRYDIGLSMGLPSIGASLSLSLSLSLLRLRPNWQVANARALSTQARAGSCSP